MCSLSSISCAKELVSIITRDGLVPGVQEHLHSEIDGLEELSVVLYDRGSNVCLETSNLAGWAGTTIGLKELQIPQELTGKPEEPRITISCLHPTRCIANGSVCTSHGQCLVTIPLLEARRSETVCHFGSLVAKVKSSTSTGTPSSESMLGAVQLAEALSFHHAQQLREFVSVVTSLLLRPMDLMEPPPLSSTLCPPLPRHSQSNSISRRQHQNQNHEQPNRLFSTLAPLASDGVPLLGPLPRVSLLTLEFEDSSLETEFHSWKAECMQNQDLWSLFACLVVIIASIPVSTAFSQLLQVGFIFMAAASTATLATIMQSSSNNQHLAFYCRHRDKIMLASSSFFTTGVYLAEGGGALYNQVFALVAVLLPVRLRWHVSYLFLVLTWRIACTASVVSTPFNLVRLILGVVIAPFILAYLVECVARRGFLSRRALHAAAAAADIGAEYEDEDEYDDEYEFYPEDEEDFWLDEDT